MAKYKIHPAIGIARVGNSIRTFIGPEVAGQDAIHRWDKNTSSWATRQMKDDGKIKRQLARFRIWEYTDDGAPVREINLNDENVEYIRWGVHLANRKAEFYCFDGLEGYEDSFCGSHKKRNQRIAEPERYAKLVLNPGPKEMRISQSDKGKVKLGPKFALPKSPFIPIDYLGELRTEEQGRLLVAGGWGNAKSIEGKGLDIHPTDCHPTFNNDYWFDDISDGPVSASFKLKGQGKELTVEPAWVIVGPPDFAPSIRNVVTLYDTLIDIAVRQVKHPKFYTTKFDPEEPAKPGERVLIQTKEKIYGAYEYYKTYEDYKKGKKTTSQGLKWLKELFDDWKKNGGTLKDFKPSFTRDIFPILHAVNTSDWVTGSLDHTTIKDWAELADPASHDLRDHIFLKLRDPENPDSSSGNMPALFGDNALSGGGLALTLTRVQYAMMQQWRDGKFISDWKCKPDLAQTITPEELDKAALVHCVGGAMCVGIEASWLIRTTELYSELFRIKHGATHPENNFLKTGPGFFTQQMSLPWQTDFWACGESWWPGNRPIQVKVQKGGTLHDKDWTRGFNFVTRWKELGFIVEDNGKFIEKEGPPLSPATTTPATATP